MSEQGKNWEGTTMPANEVAAYRKRHGVPVYEKPEGDGQVTLYYPGKDSAEESEVEEAEHYDGPTPGTKDRVVYKPARGAHIESRMVSNARAGVQAGNYAAIEGNPNEAAARAEGKEEEYQRNEEENAEKGAREAKPGLTDITE